MLACSKLAIAPDLQRPMYILYKSRQRIYPIKFAMVLLEVLLCSSYLTQGWAWVGFGDLSQSSLPNYPSSKNRRHARVSIKLHALQEREKTDCVGQDMNADGHLQQQNDECTAAENNGNEQNKKRGLRLTKLIHWRGEKSHGNSMQFRHLEFTSAIESILINRIRTNDDGNDSNSIHENEVDVRTNFVPALSSNFTSADEMSEYQIIAYENAMQYLSVSVCEEDYNYDYDAFISPNIDNDILIHTVERCSLIRSMYEIVTEADTYAQLAQNAINSGYFQDMMEGGSRAKATWMVRLRQYGASVGSSNTNKQKQFGKKMRSPMKREREAINEMKELFLLLKGDVDLKNADETIYLFEGLTPACNPSLPLESALLVDTHTNNSGRKVLARLLARGANSSVIAPKTRICVTNTPLCPLAAYTMCNAARIQPGDRIFDPFAGSCTILLAAAMMEPTVRSVGVEIGHNGQVNRDHIVQDFTSRNLPPPSAIIRGDSMSEHVRREAKAAIGNQPFDVIVTDPPYGIREKTGFCLDPPLVNLVNCIARDRIAGDDFRLLKKGGRLVAFVPNLEGDDIAMDMPSEDDLSKAGLQFCRMLEQPLNDSLSRWLVEYICIK